MANLSVQTSTLNFIAEIEKFSAKAYNDYKQWSIGYGTGIMPSGRPVKSGDTVTKEQAWEMLKRDVPLRGAIVNRHVTAPINQNQFDALVSFVYNFNETDFKNSTLLDRINANPNDFEGVAAQFRRWVNAGGVPLKGLIERREKEIRLYQSGTATPTNFFF